jgi:hypothetical protein
LAARKAADSSSEDGVVVASKPKPAAASDPAAEDAFGTSKKPKMAMDGPVTVAADAGADAEDRPIPRSKPVEIDPNDPDPFGSKKNKMSLFLLAVSLTAASPDFLFFVQ